MSFFIRCTLAFAALLAVSSQLSAEVTVEKTDGGATVKIDGQPFAGYVVKSGNKPIVWPIIGPTGKEMTRQYPLREALKTEKNDHPHHRSLWFTHGDVEGTSFWHEGKDTGEIVHREFTKLASGDEGVIQTKNDWIAPGDKLVCSDVRTFTFGGDKDQRWIDVDIVVSPPEGKSVKFGDTKEGSFGLRVPGTMDVIAKKGGKLINSEGQADDPAWGKPAAWVDYHGPVEGETLGIAIMNHPSSFRFPTCWHVRTYGLFAANPFGLKDFKAADDGAHLIKPGETLNLRYRVLFHKGDEKEGKVAEAFAEYRAKE